ncbi:hypothetical protein JJB07_08965 [Tumebacillus sp. ITR2]|uniref:Uncharacterized protein n=1 Tax=Tumebacillus amylolyticus TaxID=2801339 RepID=A0ABS1J943_9BACL|nr:hypothetical protein [Tumebacillus amylolyticus]MBL0386782.1 hypothetical protein [Tumebacillus amylolyticus]
MSEILSTLGGCLVAAAAAFLLSYLIWGTYPWWKTRVIRNLRKQERVKLISDVNTRLEGYQIAPNPVTQWVTLCLLVVWIVILYDQPKWIEFGVLVASFLWGRQMYGRAPWQKYQTFVLTDKSVLVFAASGGQTLWNVEPRQHVSWSEIDSYRYEGGYVQFFRAEQQKLQVEYNARDFEKIRDLLSSLNVKRGEPSDRIWLGQFDETYFYRLEDELTEMGWNLIDLYRKELDELDLQVEFGVIRNVAGDRLHEEYSRSWLQLNLLDEAGEQKASSMLPLWQSSGNIGHLIGARGQDAVDHLQKWIGSVIGEVQEQREEVVLS